MPSWKKGGPIAHQPSEHVLWGLKAIANYLGRGYTTLLVWHRDYGLPITKAPDGKWFTTKSALDRWIFASSEADHTSKYSHSLPEKGKADDTSVTNA